MKKLIPWVVAGVVFILALILLQPEARKSIVVFAVDLPAGHMIASVDLTIREIPVSMLPEDSFREPALVVGQTVKTDRSAGDIVRQTHLGDSVALAGDERAIAIRVDSVSGMDGTLAPGDWVGVTAVLFSREAAFSKVAIEPLRVLWVSPGFRNGNAASINQDTDAGNIAVMSGRASEGIVILAVPIKTMEVVYDFSSTGGTTETRQVNAVEMLSALGVSGNSAIVLYLVPPDAQPMTSPGLFLPDLVLIPTATPQPTPAGELQP